MSRRIIGSIAGALAATALVAPLAHAAGSPARVGVRVEAPGRTLADTTLTTTRTPVRPDGTHLCSGTSAGGALWQAVPDHWSGSWFDSLKDYAVGAFGDVRAPADFSAYWAFWLNGKVSTMGVCGTELHAGDDVLEFLCTSTPDFSSCTNLPLDLQVVRPHRGSMDVKVVLLRGDGTSTPVAGATVTGGVAPVRTAAGGTANVKLRVGQSTLRATHTGDVPSARLHCQHGRGAHCGSRDRVPPTLVLKGIANGETFAAAHAPRTLRGTAVDPEGAGVAFRLTRRSGGACTAFDGTKSRFRACGRGGAPLVDAGDGPRWSYLLPARLAAGSYRLVVIATDGAGNRRVLRVHFVVAG
ncbi:MAG: hypothetical protein ACTHOE_02455 [Conexibacter sp.]